MLAGKVSGHNCIGIVLSAKEVTLEHVNYSVPGLSKIFYIVYIAF